MDQMAHLPTPTALALPENEDGAERAWTRDLSVVLKGVGRVIQERNICTGISLTITLNRPTTVLFLTAHGLLSEEIFSKGIWTDMLQRARNSTREILSWHNP